MLIRVIVCYGQQLGEKKAVSANVTVGNLRVLFERHFSLSDRKREVNI